MVARGSRFAMLIKLAQVSLGNLRYHPIWEIEVRTLETTISFSRPIINDPWTCRRRSGHLRWITQQGTNNHPSKLSKIKITRKINSRIFWLNNHRKLSQTITPQLLPILMWKTAKTSILRRCNRLWRIFRDRNRKCKTYYKTTRSNLQSCERSLRVNSSAIMIMDVSKAWIRWFSNLKMTFR